MRSSFILPSLVRAGTPVGAASYSPRWDRCARRAVLLVAATLAACSDARDAAGPGAPAQTPTLTLAATPSPVTVQQGRSGSATLTVTRGGGFGGDVALAATVGDGAAGVSARFEPATATAGATQTTVTLATTSATPVGDHTVTVTGTGAAVTGNTTLVLRVTPASAMSLGASSPALSIARGASGTVQLTLTRAPGHSADVTLSAEGLPNGVSATFAPATLSGATTASTLTLAATTQAAVAGPVNVVLRARGAGVGDATVGLALTVASAPAAPSGSYTLAVAPATLTVVRDADADVGATVTLARTNFPGSIRLTASGVPAGVTLSMPSGPLRGGEASVSVRATASVVPGDYRVTLTGTADGLAPVTTTIPLRVLAGGATFSIGLGRRPTGAPIVMVAGTELDSYERPTIGVKRTCDGCDTKLEATGMPTGITIAFAPSGTGTPTNPAVLTRYNGWAEPHVAVAAGVRDGDYPITLTATAGSFPPVSTTLVIRVVSTGFALAVTPTTTVVAAGGGAVSATLRVLPSSAFINYVDYSVTGAPAGLTVTGDGLLYPDAGSPDFLTVQAAASVPPGDYTVTVRGVASRTTTGTSGAPGRPGGEATATFTVRVVSPTQDRGYVPAEFAGGTFKAGTVSLLSFWETHTGNYVGRNGYVAFFSFKADGTYTLLLYTLMRGTTGCSTEIWSEYAGAVTFADGTFETRPTSGRYKVADSCFGNFYSRVASSADLEANSATWYWAWERNDADGKTYLRIGFDRESRAYWNWFARTDNP